MNVVHGQVSVKSNKSVEVIDITGMVQSWVADNNAEDGILTVFSSHTTAGLTINEAESGLMQDLEMQLSKIVPPQAGYRHDRIDDNAHSHIMTSLLGPSETVIVKSGTLALGTWQRILFVECDGPRSRRVAVTFVGKTID
jgi:secondary thiamine-phosphate synthase enzyme